VKTQAGLLALGIRPEQRVAIASATRLDWIHAGLAIMCSGAATTAGYPSTADDVMLRQVCWSVRSVAAGQPVGVRMKSAGVNTASSGPDGLIHWPNRSLLLAQRKRECLGPACLPGRRRGFSVRRRRAIDPSMTRRRRVSVGVLRHAAAGMVMRAAASSPARSSSSTRISTLGPSGSGARRTAP
jgi:hypothetical protein